MSEISTRPSLSAKNLGTPEFVPGISTQGTEVDILMMRVLNHDDYQAFHQLTLIEEVFDGNLAAVRAYLAHFWRHWSGPAFEPTDERLDHLAAVYGGPGALSASVAWYRAGSGMVASSLAEGDAPARITTPTTVLWQSGDPLFPRAWSDRLDRFFSDVQLRPLDGVGHFTPLEAPQAFADAIDEFLDPRSS